LLSGDQIGRRAAEGLRQYVVLGAGLDTFAYRNPFPGQLRVFEVDQPATQSWKQECPADPGNCAGETGTVLPAGQTGKQDIDAAVRNVFMHPNTGPFVASQLIQRLVTGNPSKAYVARIAAVFNNNGNNVRGDLGAVVRAILLDSEARGGAKTAADFGHLARYVRR